MLGYRRRGRHHPPAQHEVAVAERIIESQESSLMGGMWMARALLSRQPYSVAKYVSLRYRHAVRQYLVRWRPELVIIDHAQLGWIPASDRWAVPHVYLAHNAEHRLYTALAADGGARRLLHRREAAAIRRTEQALCRSAIEVWALTSEDADSLANLGPAPVRVFDVPPSAVPARRVALRCDVALLGTWTWKANADGLRWFVDTVLPHLPQAIDVHVGGAGGDSIAVGPNVTVHGRVPDAMEFLQGARVIAVPSTTGSGCAGQDTRRHRHRTCGRCVSYRDARYSLPPQHGAG